jgi:hypothetical protein
MPAMPNCHPYCVSIKPLAFLCPSEAIKERDARALASKIAHDGMWTAPIPIDSESGIIMDGNHRAFAASLLGLRYLPCVPLDYKDDRVTVRDWDSGDPFSVESIYRALLIHKTILPYKTTRHSFRPELPKTEIPLCVLRTPASGWVHRIGAYQALQGLTMSVADIY